MSAEFDAETLAQYTGVGDTPIYISVKGTVFDVTSGRDFYGPGKSYNVFAGKEASRCLGKMEINDNEANCSWRNLSEEHMNTLNDWEAKYRSKYPAVGVFKPDPHFEIRGAQLEP